jgi:putative glutamine amidotransferase
MDLAGLVERLDGLLVTGSPSNVEPALYGGPSSVPGTLHDPERDATTLPLIRAALAVGVPVLAICRGIQELNVALGGSLHQRVQELPGKLDHRADHSRPVAEQYAKVHSVDLTPGGLLERITGKREIRVNSIHAQAIDRLADGLTVEAVAPDGLIEAVSVDNAPAFALAVQWHPEWRFWECPDSTALFQAFGQACAGRAALRHA